MHRWSGGDVAAAIIGFGFGIALLCVGVIAVRYALHPQQFRDVHYNVVRTVYVWAKPAR